MGLKVGITGGIGAGKSLVCRIFSVLGIPIYDADREAKVIMSEDREVGNALKAAFGDAVFDQYGKLDRAYLSEVVFSDEKKLKQLNSIVHPAVIKAGDDWASAQMSAYSLKEAALLFESGSYKKLDFTILVTAQESIRINRVMKRDGVTEDQVRARMSKQWSDDQKLPLADAIIINDGEQSLIEQVMAIHHRLTHSNE
ncbi:dephospho-CoA kinase [Sphingobacterium corticis]|uniref:Dephospho-CoA kinase n=1 Tax=Sphingobacterium corticis TaxID=1812823 RepID=A0ABW5NIK0_9SPHI